MLNLDADNKIAAETAGQGRGSHRSGPKYWKCQFWYAVFRCKVIIRQNAAQVTGQ